MSCCGGNSPKTEEYKSCDTTKSGCGCGCGPECKCGPGCKCGCQPSSCDDKKAACSTMKPDCSDKSDCAPKSKCCPIQCLLTVILGGLLAAMVMYLFEGFWHGTYLAPIYEQTKTLWRSVPEMQSLGGTYASITIALGIILSFIFAKNYQSKGIAEGIRYGFYIGLLLGLSHLALYLVLPISMNLATLWLFGWIIEGVLVGITLALTYMAVTGKKDCKPKGACGPVPASACSTTKEGSCSK